MSKKKTPKKKRRPPNAPITNQEDLVETLYGARQEIEKEGEVLPEDLGRALALILMSLNRGG